MWTCRVPEPGYKPRAEADALADHVRRSGIAVVDEIKQVFRCLADDPEMRPPAKRMRFFNPVQLTTSQMQIPRERIAPGTPLRALPTRRRSIRGRRRSSSRIAPMRPTLRGASIRFRDRPFAIGRRTDQDIVLPEAHRFGRPRRGPLAGRHRGWSEDLGSTNGTCTPITATIGRSDSSLLHGAEAQLGEARA